MNNHLENNYVKSMEQMRFTKGQQERMVDFMVNHKGEKGNHMPAAGTKLPFGVKRLAIAVACFCIITAGAAVANAAGVLRPVSEAFREAFHLGKDTAQISDNLGSSLGVSDIVDDVIITADAVLGDKYNFAVIFSVKKSDGTAFEKRDIYALTSEKNNIGFRAHTISTDKKWGNQMWNLKFDDVNEGDTFFRFSCTCASDTDDSIGAQVKASFTHFGYWSSSRNFVPIVEGCWNITFPLNYVDATRHFAVNQKIKQDGETIIIKKADISPIGFHIEFEGIEGDGEMWSIVNRIPMELILTDGKKIDLKEKNRRASKWTNDIITRVTFGDVFYEIIPIEKMKSVRIGGVTLDF